MSDVSKMTEKELSEEKAPTFHTIKALSQYIEKLVKREHDYGTCVYAMSLAATAAFNYVAASLGASGFQASLADLDILRQTRDFEYGKLVYYDRLLYPQYLEEEYFPSWQGLLKDPEVRANIAGKAKKLLETKDQNSVREEVWAHWTMLAQGVEDAQKG